MILLVLQKFTGKLLLLLRPYPQLQYIGDVHAAGLDIMRLDVAPVSPSRRALLFTSCSSCLDCAKKRRNSVF